MKRTIWIGLTTFLLGILVGGMILLYSPETKNTDYSDLKNEKIISSNLYASTSQQAQPIPENGFVAIAEKVGPAVVKVEAEKVERRAISPFGEEWPFDDFWERFFGRPPSEPQEFRSRAYGTGFFISSDGYILTNNHVVENAEIVRIFSLQDKEYEAKIVGTDPRTDLALLKVEDKGLPYAELGDSEIIRVGEWVIAIGNPFGMEHTVTAGIVSAKGRQLGGALNVPEYQDFIQTDAAINRGNSGGPLVNMKAEVVGITSNIFTPTGGNIGIGFAIPSNLAKKIVSQLKEKGRVIRGYLGVTVSDITQDTMKLLNLNSKKGAMIHQVEPESPAEKAGLKIYDVIVEVDGKTIEDSNDLKFTIAEISPGEKAKIKVIRDGKEKILEAKIAELEPAEAESTPTSSDKDIGISVTTLTPGLARRYGFETEEGLLITRVRQYSAADRAGLQRGDIILEVNREKMKTVKDLENILKELKSGDPLMLRLRRETRSGSQDFIVTLRIP